MDNKIKIIIADDHDIVLDGYISILQKETNLLIIGKANNGFDVLEKLKFNQVDLLILDFNMPKFNGLETTKEVKKLYPNVKILILTMFDDATHIKQMIDVGVNGYLLKNSSKSILLHAIETIMTGNPYYDSVVTQNILNKFKQTLTIENDEVILSERELQIIGLIAKGLSTQEIADKLFLSFHTIKTHRKNINFKLDIHSPAELIDFAKQKNLIF